MLLLIYFVYVASIYVRTERKLTTDVAKYVRIKTSVRTMYSRKRKMIRMLTLNLHEDIDLGDLEVVS